MTNSRVHCSRAHRADSGAGIASCAPADPPDGGGLIVLTAPLTEIIDHAGFFIQMAMASLPLWLEGILNKRYPRWRDLEYNEDGSALYMPAGVRLLEASLLRRFPARRDRRLLSRRHPQVHRSRGREPSASRPTTRWASRSLPGVYASVFGSSKEPINSHYARKLFSSLKESPWRDRFKVIVGGSGAWQIAQTGSYEELSVDCVVEGRSESPEVLELFWKSIRGEALPRSSRSVIPATRRASLSPTGAPLSAWWR